MSMEAPTTAAGARFAEAVVEHGQLAHQTLVAEETKPSLSSTYCIGLWEGE